MIFFFFFYIVSLNGIIKRLDVERTEFHWGACSVPETNVNGEQIDDSRPWKPRMDQCGEVILLSGQAHPRISRLLLPNQRKNLCRQSETSDIYFDQLSCLTSPTFCDKNFSSIFE